MEDNIDPQIVKNNSNLVIMNNSDNSVIETLQQEVIKAEPNN
ncbi:1228_t:CDS:1, partial [Cetraspora pellucida]